MKKFSGTEHTAAIRAAIKNHADLIERRRALKLEFVDAKTVVQQAEQALEQHPDTPAFDQTPGIVPSTKEIEHMVADHEQKRVELNQAVSTAKLRLRLIKDARETTHQSVTDAEGAIQSARVDYVKALEVYTLTLLDIERFSVAMRRLGAAYQAAYNARLDNEWYVNLLKVKLTDEDLEKACRELEVTHE